MKSDMTMTTPRKRARRGIANQLSAIECRNAVVGKHGDGGGLYLLVTPLGRRYWRLKYTWNGRSRLLGLGTYPFVDLQQARVLAKSKRELIQLGVDPVEHKREQRRSAQRALGATLEKFGTKVHGDIVKTKGFKNEKHGKQWLSSLKPVFASLGRRSMASLEQDEDALLDVLLPIVQATPETGKRVMQRLNVIFDAAVRRRLLSTNPMRNVTGAPELDTSSRTKGRLAALPFVEVPVFMAKLMAMDDSVSASALALRFALLTASRSGEVRGATWREIDIETRVWLVPSSRMKGGEEHRVALSGAALAVLTQAKALSDGESDAFVFPSPMGRGGLSDMALTMCVRRLGYGAKTTVHGLCRATFSSWANEFGIARPDVIEAALAHREQDRVRKAYNRATFERERAELLASWATFVTTPPENKIVSLRPHEATR